MIIHFLRSRAKPAAVPGLHVRRSDGTYRTRFERAPVIHLCRTLASSGRELPKAVTAVRQRGDRAIGQPPHIARRAPAVTCPRSAGTPPSDGSCGHVTARPCPCRRPRRRPARTGPGREQLQDHERTGGDNTGSTPSPDRDTPSRPPLLCRAGKLTDPDTLDAVPNEAIDSPQPGPGILASRGRKSWTQERRSRGLSRRQRPRARRGRRRRLGLRQNAGFVEAGITFAVPLTGGRLHGHGKVDHDAFMLVSPSRLRMRRFSPAL